MNDFDDTSSNELLETLELGFPTKSAVLICVLGSSCCMD